MLHAACHGTAGIWLAIDSSSDCPPSETPDKVAVSKRYEATSVLIDSPSIVDVVVDSSDSRLPGRWPCGIFTSSIRRVWLSGAANSYTGSRVPRRRREKQAVLG